MSRAKRQIQRERSRQAREARAKAQKRQRRKTAAIRIGAAVAVLAAAIVITSLVTGDDDNDAADATTTTLAPTTTAPITTTTLAPFTLDPAIDYSARITTNFGEIVVDVDESTPVGAAHFLKLASGGVYDGSRWHRIGSDFVIQGGAPGGDPNTPYPDSVVAELPADNYPEGSLAAAKTGVDPPGTFSAQFFITTGQAGAALPNEYARFGRVVSGTDVVEQIEALAPAGDAGEPTGEATIESIDVIETPRDTTESTTTG